MSMYDLIKKLYDELNQGDLNKAREIMSVLKKKGMDRNFLTTMFKTVAIEKMVEALYDEKDPGALKK